MVKYLATLLSIFYVGCEINSEQIIKPGNTDFDNIKFNAVSKNLKFSNKQEGADVETTKKLISSWFDKNIKIDGFEGNLDVIVNSIVINKIKKDEFYRFEINLNIQFLTTNEILNTRKVYNINSIEYGDIQGSFSLRDVETLNKNIILKCLKKINQKVISDN